MKTVLVTGGLGYIGSHTSLALHEAGYDVVIVDNLVTGDARFLNPDKTKEFYKRKADWPDLLHVIKTNKIDTVMHFAGSIVVPESVERPVEYYDNNVTTTINLLNICRASGIKNFIFSSTGSVYKSRPEPLDEDAPTDPANPYSRSKLMCEQIIKDCCSAYGIKYGILRYFNVAGANHEAGLGQISKVSTHLIKIVAEHLIGKREEVSVFGNHYHTPDGSCIRDYIHVSDLAQAHIDLMSYLTNGGESDTFNCGYGRGYSVFQILDAAKKLEIGKNLKYKKCAAREGDTACLVSDSTKIKKKLKWQPRYEDIGFIIYSAAQWERRLSLWSPNTGG